jgi:hypothetical protein
MNYRQVALSVTYWEGHPTPGSSNANRRYIRYDAAQHINPWATEEAADCGGFGNLYSREDLGVQAKLWITA